MTHIGSSAIDLVAAIGLGIVVLSLFRATGRRVLVLASGGTVLVVLAAATLLGHAG
jgi:hypothetical protein